MGSIPSTLDIFSVNLFFNNKSFSTRNKKAKLKRDKARQKALEQKTQQLPTKTFQQKTTLHFKANVRRKRFLKKRRKLLRPFKKLKSRISFLN